mmetsp:Transcript_33187/g.84248  ORF Transcript_33187/g.84248 Transcript_33187/m.84248 type:complete len:310 (-) Transcript_33187:1683-2612(-)
MGSTCSATAPSSHHSSCMLPMLLRARARSLGTACAWDEDAEKLGDLGACVLLRGAMDPAGMTGRAEAECLAATEGGGGLAPLEDGTDAVAVASVAPGCCGDAPKAVCGWLIVMFSPGPGESGAVSDGGPPGAPVPAAAPAAAFCRDPSRRSRTPAAACSPSAARSWRLPQPLLAAGPSHASSCALAALMRFTMSSAMLVAEPAPAASSPAPPPDPGTLLAAYPSPEGALTRSNMMGRAAAFRASMAWFPKLLPSLLPAGPLPLLPACASSSGTSTRSASSVAASHAPSSDPCPPPLLACVADVGTAEGR